MDPAATVTDHMVTVQEKRYTKDHEWIELSEDGKTGNTRPLPFPSKPIEP